MTEPRNTIRTFALICVAVTTAFIMAMAWWINTTLASPNWCARALGAGGLVGKDRTIAGLDGCIDLLKIQLRALGVNSHILFGVVALCLLVLIVIVIAGGRFSLKAGKDGVETNIGRDDTPEGQAAGRVAGAAVEEARQIVEEVKP